MILQGEGESGVKTDCSCSSSAKKTGIKTCTLWGVLPVPLCLSYSSISSTTVSSAVLTIELTTHLCDDLARNCFRQARPPQPPDFGPRNFQSIW